jgi:EAL domain-containing protein (putative c-di-GMP-specific phosphodiesterase class I)
MPPRSQRLFKTDGARSFKIDKIKIDRSSVESAEREPEAAALIRALMGLGHGGSW